MRLTAAFLTILFAACTAVPADPRPAVPSTMGGVRLSAERLSPGTIHLTLQNGASDPVGYNLCSSGLQHRSGSSWQPVNTGEICTMELRTLNPGATATFEKTLPGGLAAGDYRYVTNVESPLGGQMTSVATDSFRLP
jgi:hypothetical protein